MKNSKKLWGGAHTKATKKAIIGFTAGRDVRVVPMADTALIPYDIAVNKAHIQMLRAQGLIDESDYKALDSGLDAIGDLYEKGEFVLNPDLEDVHTNIEAWLIEHLGIDIGGKIHTARSRNDQILADMYLYLQDMADTYVTDIKTLVDALSTQSEVHKNTVCPGFTHHQQATVATFGYILDSFASSLKRDLSTFENVKKLFNFSPLGGAAGYGTTIVGDSQKAADALGFEKTYENSIDVITNRGEFETYMAFAISMMMTHISQLAQTLILFSTREFGYITLPDEFTTGSSIMPQKKNPDILEVAKSKTSYVHGLLSALMSNSKAAFIGYNRDAQQTKYIIMDIIFETKDVAIVLADLTRNLVVNKDRMGVAARSNFITSTGLMELIVANKAIPMRQAKRLIEMAIKYSIESGNNDFVTKKSMDRAISEVDLTISISDEELTHWQDPVYQMTLIKK